jgi:hypothetical protein
MNKIYNMVTEMAAHCFVRFFYLNFLEMATEKAKSGALEADADIHNSIVSMLALMQDRDQDIFRRGWRALCICSHCKQRPGQLPARADPLEEDVVTVIMVMERCLHDEKVQMLGFRALRILVCGGVGREPNDATFENWSCLHRAGVLSILITSMRRHPNTLFLCGTALTMIGMLLKEIGDRAKADFVRLGGLPVLMGSAEKWERETKVLQSALFTMYQLSYRTSRQSLIDNGAITFLTRCIERHPINRIVVELALGALNQISLVSPSPFREPEHSRLVPVLLALMATHEKTESIQFYSMVVLRSASSAHHLPRRGTLGRVLAAMRKFPDAGGILFFGCSLIHELLARHNNNEDEVLTLISTMGGLEVVINAVHDHPDVYGLSAVAHLILLHAWDERPTEGDAATRAFGGSSEFIPRITGLDINDFLGNVGNARQNAANQENQQNDNGGGDDN